VTTSRSTRPTGSARRPGAVATRPGARHTGPGARTGARRPASAARPRESATAEATKGTVWWRWVVLAGLVVVLLVTVVPTARNLARQNAEIDALRDKIVSQQQQLAELKAEEERWADPAYVEQQARQRLKYVKPGDRSYTVIDATDHPATTPAVSVAAPRADASAPWYGRIWQSVQLADQPLGSVTGR
jgi:cell division protein FtsL